MNFFFMSTWFNAGVDEVEFVCSSQDAVDEARARFPEKVKAKKKNKKRIASGSKVEAAPASEAFPPPATTTDHACWKELAKLLDGVRVRFVRVQPIQY